MTRLRFGLGALLACLAGCGSESKPSPTDTAPTSTIPSELSAKLDLAGALTDATLPERYPTTFQSGLGYEPRDAQWLDRIQSSSLRLSERELNVLSRDGFVISDGKSYPNFFYGYKTLYFEHLPLFVSADSILNAVHRSYDSLLMSVEFESLEPTLKRLLEKLLTQLGTADLPDTTRQDLSVYLGVAQGLLRPSKLPADAETLRLVKAAQDADGLEELELFGSVRSEDFSQFSPRGHYTEGLEDYFRAMMWLGRVDFRLVETLPDHSRVLRRRAVEAMVALRQLMTPEVKRDLDALEQVVAAFVGEPDYMAFGQIETLMNDLGVTSLAELSKLSDATIKNTIEEGGYGVQRIASHLMVNGIRGKSLPNNSSFALLGQRYVLDSHVFSNVTYSRFVADGAPLRMMPDPLDVAFAALGNNQAAQLLAPQLARYGYAPALAQTRVLVDEHPADYWDSSLYTLWLGSVRAMSGQSDVSGIPSVAKTAAWGKRVLNTQLASWAELRHDTLLYAKQSYTDIPECEYPDAYVDPYPEVFAGLARFATRGKELLSVLQGTEYPPDQALQYLDKLASIASILRDMAEQQRSGQPHSAEALAFINRAVTTREIDVVCTTVEEATGWYADLFFNPEDIMEFDPTIADVHTQPADESGSIVGKVLHVATGNARTAIVTVDSCNGPRAYAGVVSSYFEQVTEQFQRLNDEQWADGLNSTPPSDVPWLADLVQR